MKSRITICYDAIAGVREFQRPGSAVEEARVEVPIAGVYGHSPTQNS